MSTQKQTVLLIDDEEVVRNLLKRALAKEGYHVELAHSLNDAYSVFDKTNPALILCDKNLPDGSGLQFIERIRQLGYDGEIIVITGYSDTDSAIKSLELGAFRYVRKPFDLDALKMDMRKALETYDLKQNLKHRSDQLQKKNEELREAMAQIQRAERKKIQSERLASIGNMAAGIAHEINNPLSLISMTIPYLNTEIEKIISGESSCNNPERLKAKMAKMHRSMQSTRDAVELLMTLAHDLHSLGKSDQSTPQSVKIHECIHSAVRIVRHKLKYKARISVDVPDNLSIRGKSNRLIQVFINLLTNAGRAIEDGNRDNNFISFRGYKQDGHVIIEVADSGVGIHPSNIDRIFDRFATFSHDQSDEGSGIGLSIVKQIIEEHKGTVEVESKLNAGTHFYVRFPDENVRTSSPPPILALQQRDTPTDFIRARRQILFVDDNVDHLEAYTSSFGTMHDVLVAANSADALSQIKRNNESLDIIVFEHNNDSNFAQTVMKAAIADDPSLEGNFICTAENRPKVNIPCIIRPFRPAELLAAIYQIPPRTKK